MARDYKLVTVTASPLKSKKYRAIFSDGDFVDFGASGYDDFTTHGDIKRRDNYRRRHRNDNLSDPKSAGALSWYLLWGSETSLKQNIKYFKHHFKI